MQGGGGAEEAYAPMIFDEMEVLAALMSPSRPILSTLTARFSLMYLQASLLASRKPLMMEVGCILCFTKSLARYFLELNFNIASKNIHCF